MSTRRRLREGFTVVLVIWMLALLSLLALSFVAGLRTEADAARNIEREARREAVLEAGLQVAIAALHGAWPESDWPLDGRARTITVAGATVAVALSAEAGRIDLNASPRSLLQGMLVAYTGDVDKSGQLADQILDWRDGDSRRRLQGAERKDYEEQGMIPLPNDAPFERLDELTHVLDLEGNLAELLYPAVTVFSGRQDPDPELALPAVRTVLRDSGAVPGRTTIETSAGYPSVGTRPAPLNLGQAFRIEVREAILGDGLQAIVWLPPGGRSHRLLDWRRLEPSTDIAIQD